MTQAIHGLGGVGKTQLALEYAYRHAGDYELIWPIRSDEPIKLASDVTALADPLDLPEKNLREQPLIVSLIEVSGHNLTVHRMVQAATRDRLNGRATKRWVEVAVKTVNAAYPQKSHDLRTWSECVPLSPHASQVCERAERLTIASDATGRLLNQLALYLRADAEFDRARTCYERAPRIFRKFLGDEHPDTRTVRKNLESLEGR